MNKECMNKISSLSSIWKFIYYSTYYTPNCIRSNIYYLIDQQSNVNFNYQDNEFLPNRLFNTCIERIVKEAYLYFIKPKYEDKSLF